METDKEGDRRRLHENADRSMRPDQDGRTFADSHARPLFSQLALSRPMCALEQAVARERVAGMTVPAA